jgi:predicted ATPase
MYAALRADAGNLAAFLLAIRNTPSYSKIAGTIQRVAPFFQDFLLQPDRANPELVRLRWKHRGTDAYFDANDLSDGTLRFIALTTMLLQPQPPAIILLDEPELGLHPHAIHLLAGLLRSAARLTQIIVSTQSVTLANQFEYRDLVVVDRADECSRFRRLPDEEVRPWLDEYAIGDLWEKNLIGGTP